MAHRSQNRSAQQVEKRHSPEESKHRINQLQNVASTSMNPDLSFLYDLLPTQSLLAYPPNATGSIASLLLSSSPTPLLSSPTTVAGSSASATVQTTTSITPPPPPPLPLRPVTSPSSQAPATSFAAALEDAGATAASATSHTSGRSLKRNVLSEEVLSQEEESSAQCSRIFESQERFEHVLEAPTSMMTPRGEDTVTYLNKGQFYAIHSSYNHADTDGELPALVRSEVYLVFREEKDAQSELGYWDYWHSQQANPNQRGLEIDQRSFRNIQEVDTIANNAYSFKWNPAETARVVVRVNCLSTEFSTQKGVKGIPLFLMMDTYEDVNASMESEPAHRCYCKVKVFRDKGAERKNKDESKSADRRMAKILKQQSARKRPRDGATGATSVPAGDDQVVWVTPGTIPPAPPLPPNMVSSSDVCASGGASASSGGALCKSSSGDTCSTKSSYFQAASKVTHLTPTSTLSRKPVAFVARTPGMQSLFDNKAASELLMSTVRAGEAKRTFKDVLLKAADGLDDLDMSAASAPPQVKTARVEDDPGVKLSHPLTIYVRKSEETIYNAVMLYSLTVQEVAENISKRYHINSALIKAVYKHTKKGILVNMENRMVECFENEDDLVVRFEQDKAAGGYTLYLSY
eukprot:scpid32861/ scgid32641/ Grainyhead-like protein 2 homolog; Transcription factor CP2-like 3